jgi:hypothetical protein
VTLLQGDEGEFERLLKTENAVELCVALGLDEVMVAKRYEAIRKLQDSLGIKSKTPTIASIRHLIYRLATNNPFGDERHYDGFIGHNYHDHDWLSFVGVNVDRQNPANALNSVKDALEREGWRKKFSSLWTGMNGSISIKSA